MKLLLMILVFGVVSHADASWQKDSRKLLKEYKAECRSTEVVVDQIIRNDSITGHINGLPTDALEKFMVVFYIKTDQWYVHPYAYYEGQDEGYSYANLDANGNFKVRTILRDVPAKELAAIVVPKSYKIKDSRWWLKPFLGLFGGVLKYQCNHTIVPGNGDFFMESL